MKIRVKLQHQNNQTLMVLRKKRSRGVTQKKRKKKTQRESLEFLASRCTERQDSRDELPCVRLVASGCRRPVLPKC